MLRAIHYVIDSLLYIYIWIIIIDVVLSWLINFNIINQYNQFVRVVHTFCYRATEPFLRPIRRFMPDLGGLDVSPVIAILLIGGTRILLFNLLILGRLL
jgi:YggT family protein